MGLEKNGVHSGIRINAAGLGLHQLGASHFLSQRSYAGVESHVLRLERRHVIAVLKENTAQSCRENAFSCIGAGTLNHQGRFGSLTDNGGAVSRQFGAQSFRQQGVFLRRADAGAQPASRFQPRIIGTVAQCDAVFFQEPGCQAMRRPRQAEEKEVGLGREYGDARQGRRACGTGRPGVPGSGRVPCLPRRRAVPARPSPLPPQRHSRSRRAGIAAAAPRAERHRWKNRTGRRPCRKTWLGSAEPPGWEGGPLHGAAIPLLVRNP